MRIILVDDHALFRDGLASLLERSGHEVIAQLENGQQAIELICNMNPDLVLMDIRMPKVDGITALQKIKEVCPETLVVMLTISDTDADLFAAIQAGADGYLLKGLNTNEFLEMLAGLERGEAAITRIMTTRLLAGMRQIEKQSQINDKLTPREIQILNLLGKGLSNHQIADQLFISENTVKYHVRNLLGKLGVKNRTEAVSYALREGLIDVDRTNE